MKKITFHLIITLILTINILGGVYGNTLYFLGEDGIAYGASDNWTDIDSSDLGSAFRAYCKSRNLAIEGSILDATTTWTTETVNSICNSLGIDITTLQAQCKKATDGNIGYKWLFSVTGMSLWNRIFAEFLQNNDLSVGDSNVNKTVYNGKYFTDNEGNKCLIYVVNKYSTSIGASQNDLLQIGTYYWKSTDDLVAYIDSGNTTIKYPCYAYTYYGLNKSSSYGGTYKWVANPNRALYYLIYGKYNNLTYKGYSAIAYCNDKNSLYGGYVSVDSNGTYYWEFNTWLDNGTSDNCDVDVVSPEIKPNLPDSDKSTIIDDDGNTSGGGSGDPDTPNPPNPGGTVPDNWPSGTHGSGTVGSDGTWDFDIPFSLPDLNIDWSISGLTEKFPFSIPFDLVSFYTMLNAEPRAPAIDANIPLGDWYTWHFEADFSQYENWAEIIRNVEFIGFVIGLIYITIRLVKG